MKRYRSISANPEGLRGVELATDDELREIEPLIRGNLHVEFDKNYIYLNLNPNPSEGERLLEGHPEFQSIHDEYGFISPTVLVIEDYVKFYMLRYKKGHSERDVREGLKVEKAFDIILQNAGLYVNYPEPIRDWREGQGAPYPQPCDFYIPLFGKLEIKSVTDFRGSNRVNVPSGEWCDENADYLVALSHIGGCYVMLCGAMPSDKVNSYVNGNYHIKHSKSPEFTGPFLSIPLDDFPIKGRTLYETLLTTRKQIDELPQVKIEAT